MFIFSVSLQAFPKIPTYNQMLIPIKESFHPHTIEVDYLL